jgi:hypothetical protein
MIALLSLRTKLGMDTETLITAPKAVRLAVARALLEHRNLVTTAEVDAPEQHGRADRDEDRHCDNGPVVRPMTFPSASRTTRPYAAASLPDSSDWTNR